MIDVKGLQKNYGGLQVLKGVDLTINKGDCVVLVGPSGCGKSTFLRLINQLETLTGGEIDVDGEMIGYKYVDKDGKQVLQTLNDKEVAEQRSKLGMVFQRFNLFPHMTALENVMIPALIGGEKQSDAEQEAKRILDFLSLSDRLGHKPAQLSGGEKQRVAVARALINRPSVILADEPSGSLDSKNKIELHKLFFDLRDEFKQTFVIVTHDETLARMTDRTLFMKDGSIVSPASVEE